MTTSTIKLRIKSILRVTAALCFWLAVWMFAAYRISKEVILPSPSAVLLRLTELGVTEVFWKSIAYSMYRICFGFILGAIAGLLIGGLSYFSRVVRSLLSPLLTIVKATPVASFIILALMFFEKSNTVIFISVLIVIPIISQNTLTALENKDNYLFEVCQMYNIKGFKRMRLLYLPSVFNYFLAGSKSSFGLAWKAGIAAEVLCTPKNSIGKNLYESKIYLETADVFAWTACVVILSILLEKIALIIVSAIKNKKSARKAA